MSLFAAFPVAEQSEALVPSLFASSAAAPFVPPPLPASFMTFSSAPDLAPPPPPVAAAARSSSSRGAIDLTRSRSRERGGKSERKKHKEPSKKEKKSKRSRSRSRSRSRERQRKHDVDRDGSKRGKDAKQKKSKRTKRDSPSSAAAHPFPPAVAASSSADAMEIDWASSSDEDDAAADAAELAQALAEKNAARARMDEAEDRRKILAIEARLADPKQRGSYLTPFTAAASSAAPASTGGFVVDRRGDMNTLLFVSIYARDVPEYFLAGGGSWMVGAALLGLSHPRDIRALLRRRAPGLPAEEPLRLRRHAADELAVRRDSRYFASKWTRRAGVQHALAVAVRSRRGEADEFQEGSEFVTLNLPLPAPNAMSDANLAADAEGSGLTSSARLIRLYSLALRAHPQSVALWLSCARAQERLIDPTKTVRSGQALWEKQCAILQRALEAIPGDRALTEALLRVGARTWPPARTAKEFADATRMHPTSLQLWRAWANWTLRCSSTRGVDQQSPLAAAESVYLLALHTLRAERASLPSSLRSGSVELQSESLALTQAMVSLLGDFLGFLRRAGHSERAFGLVQAVVEANAFRPTVSLPVPLLEALGNFWDSDVARVGEGGARGFAIWCQGAFGGSWAEEGDSGDDGDDAEGEVSRGSDDRDEVSSWLRHERALETKQWYALRSAPHTVRPTESTSSALARVVLFDDVRDFVVQIDCVGLDAEDAASVTTQFALSQLRATFDLPAGVFLEPGSSSSFAAGSIETESFEHLPFLFGSKCDDPFIGPLASARPVFEQDYTAPVQGEYVPVDLATLRNTDRSTAACVRRFLDDSDKVAFVRNGLAQLLAANPQSTALRTARMCFEYAISAAEQKMTASAPPSSVAPAPRFPLSAARDLTKSFLKADPTNLALINAYALLEFAKGSEEAACRVFERTLAATSQLSDQAKQRFPPSVLFWNYAHSQLVRAYRSKPGDSGEETDADASATLIREALHTLLCASEQQFTPFDPAQPNLRPTRLVKARTSFAAALTERSAWSVPSTSLAGTTVSGAVANAAMLLWLEYLTRGVEAAIAVWKETVLAAAQPAKFASKSATFSLGDAQHEWLCTTFLRLLTAHRSRQSFAPRLFRAEIFSALKSFPSNSFFLSLLVDSYRGSAASGELRAYFEEQFSGTASSEKNLPSLTELPEEDAVAELLTRSERSQHRPASLIVWLHAIHFELIRAGSANRVIALLERAIEAHSGSAVESALLWRFAIRHAVVRGRCDEAVKWMHRAVQECVESKAVWLDAIEWISSMPPPPALPSDKSKLTSSKSVILSPSVVREFFVLASDRGIRQRALLPSADFDDVVVTERPWDRYVREQQRREEDQERSRRARDRQRSRSFERGRSRSRERQRAGRRSRSRSRSSSHSSPPRRRRGRSRSRSRSRSSSPSRSRSRSRRRHRSKRTRSRSPSSSLERARDRYRAPLPTKPREDD